MGWIERQATVALWAFIGIARRVAAEQLGHVRPRGPLIPVAKRISPLETPRVFVQRRPCPVVGFALAEGWGDPPVGRHSGMWGAIPLRRG